MNIISEQKNTEHRLDIKPSCYFTVSDTKFLLMTFCTLGLYELYWFYKNWVYIRDKQKSNIMPFWRAFFAPLWTYYLFDIVNEDAENKSLGFKLNPLILAISYFVLQAMSRLPDPYWLIAFFSYVIFLPANHIMTVVNKKLDPSFVQNSSIEKWDWIAAIIGGTYFVLIMTVRGSGSYPKSTQLNSNVVDVEKLKQIFL